MRYMKIKILVILILLVLLVVAALFLYYPQETEQEFGGTFVKEDVLYGYLYQTEKESGFT